MGSKKTTKQESQQTTTAAPPSWTMPGIAEASGRVTQALGQTALIPKYQGPFVAQPDMALVDKAKGAYVGAAEAIPAALQTLDNTTGELLGVRPVSTGRYDVGGAYDLTPAIEAATRPIFRQLTEQALPGLRSSAIESGAYSGNRSMDIAPAQLIAGALRDAQDTAATIGLEDYSQREARRLQGYQTDEANALEAARFNNTFSLNRAQLLPDLIDQGMKLRTSAGDLYGAANDLGTAAEQAGINDSMARYEYDLQYPFRGLDIASALLSQLSGNYGTTSSTGTQTTTQKTGGVGSVVSGLAGLASLAGSFAMPGGGTLGGKLLGSLFSKKAA